LNRAGVPLMEIVSEPDMNSSLEAVLFVKKLHLLLKHIGTCEGNLEMVCTMTKRYNLYKSHVELNLQKNCNFKGSLRCDANVSVRKQDKSLASSRCEIKNLNSIKSLNQAIGFYFAFLFFCSIIVIHCLGTWSREFITNNILDYEAIRQISLLESGSKVQKETRFFDASKKITIPGRTKEEERDYRKVIFILFLFFSLKSFTNLKIIVLFLF
jgi:aspartyl-tRNA(Asn)/glutamyl-tRNA(Gln) amidotransferase subunit B